MPCTVTAFSVKIDSPGDAAMEVIIAREVIREWNSWHTLEQKRILLPLDGEEALDVSPSDLLIAFLCDSPGTPQHRAADQAVEDQLREGRPAHVYFSGGRVDLTDTDAIQGRALDEFRKRYATATIDSYGDEKEFRAKFARHLETTLNTHPHFQEAGSTSAVVPVVAIPPAAAPVPGAESLSDCARAILVEACDDFEAYIGRIKVGGVLKIQANGKQLVEPGGPAVVAKWENAFDELLKGQLIHDAGCNGQLFQISAKGFDFLKSIGKTPVGYIAEMGGM